MTTVNGATTTIRENSTVSSDTALKQSYLLLVSFTSDRNLSRSSKVVPLTRIFLERHYGKELIAERLQLSTDEPKVELLWLKLYKVGHWLRLIATSNPINASTDRSLLRPSMASIMASNNIRKTPLRDTEIVQTCPAG